MVRNSLKITKQEQQKSAILTFQKLTFIKIFLKEHSLIQNHLRILALQLLLQSLMDLMAIMKQISLKLVEYGQPLKKWEKETSQMKA